MDNTMKPSRRKLSLRFPLSQSRSLPGSGLPDVSSQFRDGRPTSMFLLLPFEIRVHIFEYLFEGSVATYHAAKKIGIHKYRRYIATSPSSTHFINLVCKQCYEECLQLFYTRTVFDLSQLHNPYHTIKSLLLFPPRVMASLVTHLTGLPLHCIASSGLENFVSLKTVVISLPPRAMTHFLESNTATRIMEKPDQEIYERIKHQPDWQGKQSALRSLVVKYPDTIFKSSMEIVCHERRDTPAIQYDSFMLSCEYDPHTDKLVILKRKNIKFDPH